LRYYLDLPVRAVGNTGQCIVPSKERSHETEGTTSNDTSPLGVSTVVLKVTDTKHEESQVKGEKEAEKRNGGAEGADEPIWVSERTKQREKRVLNTVKT
jgi:hypothetical protein